MHDRVHAAAAPTHGVHESAPAVLDATSTPAAPAAAPSQAVLFRVDERGKVHYQADTAFNRWWHRGGDYHQMTNAQFALWKGAGKRHASNKITDPTTGQSYAYNGATGQFHLHDKTMPNNYGAAVSNVGSWWGWGESPNAALQRRLGAGELVDRRRANRTAAPLEPFDVGTYTAPITIGTTTYHPLPTAHGVWAANNDHIVSGQSIRRRAPTLPQAQHNYDRGAVIAIDNPTMHRHISPTYGGRQTTIDTDAAGTAQRVVMDEHNPSRAYARDVFTMLDKTAGLDVSAAGHAVPQPALDLTVPANRLRQMGAYRTHYRLNTKLNQTSPQRGIDPADPAEDYVETPTGGHVGRFTYAPVAGTQGDLITRRFLARLRNEHFATQV